MKIIKRSGLVWSHHATLDELLERNYGTSALLSLSFDDLPWIHSTWHSRGWKEKIESAIHLSLSNSGARTCLLSLEVCYFTYLLQRESSLMWTLKWGCQVFISTSKQEPHWSSVIPNSCRPPDSLSVCCHDDVLFGHSRLDLSCCSKVASVTKLYPALEPRMVQYSIV